MSQLDELLRLEGRDPAAGSPLVDGRVCIWRQSSEVKRKVAARTQGKRSAQDLRRHGVVVGIPAEFREQLAALEQAGVQRVMLQWLDLDDLEGLEALAKAILC